MRVPPRRVVVPVALLGAGATLAAASATWVRGEVPTAISTSAVSAAGTSAAPAVPALALVGLAAAAAVAIGRRWAAVVAAVVLLAAGAGVLAASTAVVLDPEPALLEEAGRVSGVRQVQGPVSVTAAPYLSAALGGLVLAAGLAALPGAWRWQQAGRRFEPGAARPDGVPSAPARRAAGDRDRAMDDWDALGRGEDPSALTDPR